MCCPCVVVFFFNATMMGILHRDIQFKRVVCVCMCDLCVFRNVMDRDTVYMFLGYH